MAGIGPAAVNPRSAAASAVETAARHFIGRPAPSRTQISSSMKCLNEIEKQTEGAVKKKYLSLMLTREFAHNRY
jgi:hypothetical protein